MLHETKYETALAQLEQIARKMESGEYDIDQLSAELKKAQELIRLCKEKLAKADADIKTVLADAHES